MRFVGNRQEPEENPHPQVNFKPVTPELPLEKLEIFPKDLNAPSVLWELLHYGQVITGRLQ